MKNLLLVLNSYKRFSFSASLPYLPGGRCHWSYASRSPAFRCLAESCLPHLFAEGKL